MPRSDASPAAPFHRRSRSRWQWATSSAIRPRPAASWQSTSAAAACRPRSSHSPSTSEPPENHFSIPRNLAVQPQELLYAKSHEWVHVDRAGGSPIATVGISHFAVEALTDLVYLELPEAGR